MATTTNYGWTTPDDTALVKDGASAIRTLGSSVDTTTKALNPSTTLGDIEYRSSTANTNTRLGIGTTGQVLSVSGGVPAWTTPAAAVPAFNEQVFTSSGTFTPATGVTKVVVEIVSGGGSGGCDTGRGGGGGSAGGTLNQLFTVTPGVGVTVTIGAGGAAVSSSGVGNNGSQSSFDAVAAEEGIGGTREIANNMTDRLSMSGSAIGSGKKAGSSGTANGGAGGAGSDSSGAASGAGGSGRVTVRWLA
jgi:hypothetical protein